MLSTNQTVIAEKILHIEQKVNYLVNIKITTV